MENFSSASHSKSSFSFYSSLYPTTILISKNSSKEAILGNNGITTEKKRKLEPGTVVLACNLSYSGGS
jgi:hypothetical protein